MTDSRRQGEALFVEVEAMHDRFPADCSVYGVRGMAGNSADWTSTEHDTDGDVRVVRGSAWATGEVDTRCACRSLTGPDFASAIIGFRLVVPAPGAGA